MHCSALKIVRHKRKNNQKQLIPALTLSSANGRKPMWDFYDQRKLTVCTISSLHNSSIPRACLQIIWWDLRIHRKQNVIKSGWQSWSSSQKLSYLLHTSPLRVLLNLPFLTIPPGTMLGTDFLRIWIPYAVQAISQQAWGSPRPCLSWHGTRWQVGNRLQEEEEMRLQRTRGLRHQFQVNRE